MALTYTEQTFADRTVEVYEIDTDALIVKGFLDSRDEKIIEDAVAGGGVATVQMPNGQGTVLEYYSAFAKTAEELQASYFNAYATLRPAAVLADHEERLVAQETAA